MRSTLLQVLFGVNQRLRVEDVDSPLIEVRPVKTVLLLVVTGDRGLCGGYNSIAIKKVGKRTECSFPSNRCRSDDLNHTYPSGLRSAKPRCARRQSCAAGGDGDLNLGCSAVPRTVAALAEAPRCHLLMYVHGRRRSGPKDL